MAEPDPPRDTDAATAAALADLRRVLIEIQRRGGIGRGDVDDGIAHARQFVEALPTDPGLVIDIGSGGGLPGLVIAALATGWRVVLIERRAKRVDLLRYGVRALAVDNHTEVVDDDVRGAAARADLAGAASAVTARSVAPPLEVLSMSRPLLAPDGVVIISEPPGGAARWSAAELARAGYLDLGRVGGVRRFQRR